MSTLENNVSESAIADTLQEEITVGYKPVVPLEAMWMSGTDFPQITLRRDLEFMQMHPIVTMGLGYYRSGISGTQFWGGPDPNNPDPNDMNGKPISPDPRVTQFVRSHVERFWTQGVPVLQDAGYPYGWAPGEHMYRESSGYLIWDYLKGFHPNDGFVLTYHQNAVGIRVKNIRDDPSPPDINSRPDKTHRASGSADLWFASGAVPAKAAWYAHRPRFNQHYGRSQLIGAWRPWRRLGWRDGFEQVVDAAVYRAGYRGPIVKHPMEDAQTAQQGIPATRLDGASNPRRSARDVARQMVEWAKAGAGFTMSSAQYPPTQGGGSKWELDWPDHVMDVRPLIEACRYLEDQIFMGIEVPPELVKAGGVGSGYQGRSIPREAFLAGQQKIADAMLAMFVDQVLRPLVLWNFGAIPFEIYCKSILKSQSGQDQGGGQDQGNKDFGKSEAAKKAWETKRLNREMQPGYQSSTPQTAPTGTAPASSPSSPSPSLSIQDNEEYKERVFSVARRVLQRRAG